MTLVIEAVEEDPSGLPTVSVTHYGEQNSDLIRDSEMCHYMHLPKETCRHSLTARTVQSVACAIQRVAIGPT
jgi:hypothetical protein